jgi:adenine-specific DNA-methyltransferase
MHYIGSKKTLAPVLIEHICRKWPDHREWNLLDAFAGTGAFSAAACEFFDAIFVNDWEQYAYIFLKAQFDPPAIRPSIPEVTPTEGYISAMYGPPARMYFTAENARLIDGFRRAIKDEYLVACLLHACDRVANITSVYGAYLKEFKASSNATLVVKHVPASTKRARVTRLDAARVVSSVPSKTILYLDPPYNHRQYGANYFPLNVIANLGETPELKGITGIPVGGYLKSDWCSKKTASLALREVITASAARRIAMSYNDEGIMTHQEVLASFTELGWQVELVEIPYKKFKAGKYDAPDTVTEYLFLASKDFLEQQ